MNGIYHPHLRYYWLFKKKYRSLSIKYKLYYIRINLPCFLGSWSYMMIDRVFVLCASQHKVVSKVGVMIRFIFMDCRDMVASFAIRFAFSFPGMPTWEGTLGTQTIAIRLFVVNISSWICCAFFFFRRGLLLILWRLRSFYWGEICILKLQKQILSCMFI